MPWNTTQCPQPGFRPALALQFSIVTFKCLPLKSYNDWIFFAKQTKFQNRSQLYYCKLAKCKFTCKFIGLHFLGHKLKEFVKKKDTLPSSDAPVVFNEYPKLVMLQVFKIFAFWKNCLEFCIFPKLIFHPSFYFQNYKQLLDYSGYHKNRI